MNFFLEERKEEVILICGHKGSYKCGIYRTVPISLETLGKSQGLTRSLWYMWYLDCLYLAIQGKVFEKTRVTKFYSREKS